MHRLRCISASWPGQQRLSYGTHTTHAAQLWRLRGPQGDVWVQSHKGAWVQSHKGGQRPTSDMSWAV